MLQKITLTLKDGKKFIINSPKNGDENRYISSQKLNGKNYSKTYLNHFEMLKKAGNLDFEMSNLPNKNRKTSDSDFALFFLER
ncbi:glycoside hydrolase domain-containing protein [Halpernia sp. GG3]